MPEILRDRFANFKSGLKNIIFDIGTSRVARINSSSSQYVEKVVNLLTKYDCDVNSGVLKDSCYEDGSNLAININLTPACNLKCIYCFAQGGSYGCIEKPMNTDIIEYLNYLIKSYKTHSNKIRLEFFGGEPLLNFKVIKEILNYTKMVSKKENIDFIYRISTNMTFVDEEIIDILGKNNFIISISIDGGKEVQDLYRPFKNNEGSFDTIMGNIKLIRGKYKDLILVARMTIAQKSVTIYENIKQLVSTGDFDYVSIYPASVKSREDSEDKYKYYFDEDVRFQLQQVIVNYEDFFKMSSRFKGILEYEKVYDEILNGKLSINHCAAGGTYFTLSGDRCVVSCHRLCGKDEFLMNSCSEALDDNIIGQWTENVDRHETCSGCWARYICGGGCKQEHLSANGSIKNVNLSSCEYHKFIIQELILNLDRFTDDFNKRQISVDDLFVYCGRPVVLNGRNNNVREELRLTELVKIF